MGMECEGCGLGEWYSSVIDKQVALLKFKNRERERESTNTEKEIIVNDGNNTITLCCHT